MNLRSLVCLPLAILIVHISHAGSAQAVNHAAGQASTSVSALLVSDIHFDPFADPSSVKQLADTPIDAWKSILEHPAADSAQNYLKLLKDCGTRGPDTPFGLLKASLAEMKSRAPGAIFVTVSGDLLAHGFECKLEQSLPTVDANGRVAFVAKTIEFVAGQMRQALPGIPIYFALGNNDSDCGDYRLDTKSNFFSTIAQVLTSDVSPAMRNRAVEDFSVAGYYAVDLPAPIRDARLLIVDDTFMAARFLTCSGKDDRTGERLTLDWMGSQLDAARTGRRKVWVMGHIPPGIDLKGSISHGTMAACDVVPKDYLDSEALANRLVDSSQIIKVGIFGHTHMDEMHLLTSPGSGNAPAGNLPIKIVPSISPINGNHSSFVVASIDPDTAQITDYKLIVASGPDHPDIQWSESYDYQQTYAENIFDASAMARLAAAFRADNRAQAPRSEAYIHNFMPGTDAKFLSLVWPTYVCALSTQDPATFSTCSCPK